MKILVTGSAGFIGYHLTADLLKEGHVVVGVDSLNDYYDIRLKEHRNNELIANPNYHFKKVDLANFDSLSNLLKEEKAELIIHLAGQAGVRYSLIDPWSYDEMNLLSTINVFEAARQAGIKRVIFASSSSVYGANKKVPFSETDMTDSPVSLYAASKKGGELIAHTYHHLYGIEVAALRFFTVYGSWYRPDMALFLFSRNILRGQPIKLFNHGNMQRDFTHVNDIVLGIKAATFKKELGFEAYNLGSDAPVELKHVLSLLEEGLGVKAEVEMLPMQAGDVVRTCADLTKSRAELGFNPTTKVEEGVVRFGEHFKEHKDFFLSLEDGK